VVKSGDEEFEWSKRDEEWSEEWGEE